MSIKNLLCKIIVLALIIGLIAVSCTRKSPGTETQSVAPETEAQAKAAAPITIPGRNFEGTWFTDSGLTDELTILFFKDRATGNTQIRFHFAIFRLMSVSGIAKLENDEIKFKDDDGSGFSGTMTFYDNGIKLVVKESPLYDSHSDTFDFSFRKSEGLPVTLFFPNDDFNGFDKKMEYPVSGAPEHIVSLMVSEKILPEGVALLDFSIDGKRGYIDMNTAYGDALRGMGTTGEAIYLGVLVNTFLTIFDNLHEIMLTEEGKVIETGHVIIDFPIRYMSKY